MTIVELHQALRDRGQAYEDALDEYRLALDRECERLPIGWAWDSVSATVVCVRNGRRTVSMTDCGSVFVDEGERLMIPARVLEAMRIELEKAKA